MTLNEELGFIRSREDLGEFVQSLADNLRDHPEEWENPDLVRYLEAMSGWIADMHGHFRNIRGKDVPEQPTWEMFGMMLLAAKYYE
jgi:hypothetical protein